MTIYVHVLSSCHVDLRLFDYIHRQITPIANFELCKCFPEDPLHSFWLCKEVECVCQSCSWANQSVPSPPSNFCDLLNCFLQFHENFQKEIFVFSAWLLWNRRNGMHFGRLVQPLSNIYPLAGSLLQEFLEAQNSVPTVIRPPIQQLWRPLDQARYKVNFDAAVFKPSNSAGSVAHVFGQSKNKIKNICGRY